MDEHPNRIAFVVVAVLIAGTVLVGLTLSGGQVSRILSTVGGPVNNQDTTGGGGVNEPAATIRPTAGSDQVAAAGAAVPTLLIVRTGQITLVVRDLDAALRDGDAAVVRAGGYVSGSDRNGTGDDGTATVTYRIPSAAWDTTVATLHGLATSVSGEKIQTEEVSDQVVDLTARLANLRSTEAALQAIMARATKISDVLDVQKQLTTTRGDIEKLVAQKEHLLDRASFGSLTVTFHLPAKAPSPTPTPKPAKGWDPGDDVARASERLVGIGQATTTVGIWLTIVGLPVLVAAAVLVFVGWQLYRVGRWVARRRDRLAPAEG
jgi:hypothetical protein